MSELTHDHDNKLIKDVDDPFIIDTVTRTISSGTNNKLTLMQYDHNSERYTFKIDRYVDEHDLLDCDRVQIHFINIASNKQKHPHLYPVTDLMKDPSDENKLIFTWLVSNNATMYNGTLGFLVSFECTKNGEVIYRWSTNSFGGIVISQGMNNGNAVYDIYEDELLYWQNYMQTEFIPNLVDKCYVERVFATSEEVAQVLGINNTQEVTNE